MVSLKPEIYTDGSCIGQDDDSAGGYAAVCCRRGKVVKIISGGERGTTNNRMELKAAIVGLKTLKKRRSIAVVTDSQYMMFGITKWLVNWKRAGWKGKSGQPVANRDLWIELDKLCVAHNVEWKWVRGHMGNAFNERADAAAGAMAKKLWEERRPSSSC